jgi:hypothetical protein
LQVLAFRANSALTVEAVKEIKRSILDGASQTQPDLEVHIEEITEGLEALAVKTSASVNAHPRELEEERSSLEAEKQAMEQSQLICATAAERVENAPSQTDRPSVHVVFSGAYNSGLQLGQNTGVISNLKWGSKP